MKRNPYTCRLFRRIDKLIYWLRRDRPYWSNQGHLCIHGGEAKSFLPGAWYVWACDTQNKFHWTRKVLSV